MIAKMPDYHMTITESESVPEILVGVRNGFFSFVTQRNEIASGVPTLRPWALATIETDGKTISFLFLHLKSFGDLRSWGLRDDMFRDVDNLTRTIERSLEDGAKANFMPSAISTRRE